MNAINDSWDQIPYDLRAAAESRLDVGESPLAWLELDLDNRLHFSAGLIVLTARHLLAIEQAGMPQDESSVSGKIAVRSWPLNEIAAIRAKEQGGVGRLELLGATELLGHWRFTIGRAAAAHRIANRFESLRRGKTTGENEGEESVPTVCPSCGALLAADQGTCPDCDMAQAKPPVSSLFRLIGFVKTRKWMVLIGLALMVVVAVMPIAMLLFGLVFSRSEFHYEMARLSFEADPDGYRCLAENLVDRGIFGYGATPTAYRPPLYPLMLAPLVAMGNFATAAIGILHVVLGVATVALVYRLARAWQLGKFSIVAAALVAVDPLLLKQSTLVMTETPAALLAVVALLALTTAAMRPRSLTAAGAGAAVALAALCRPTFLPWMAVSALVLPWFVLAWADRLRIFAAYCLAASIVLSPWMVRNQIHFGRPIAGTTHGGYTLLLANNPWFYQHLQTESWRTVWPADALNQWWVAHTSRATPRDELDADLWAYDAARDGFARQRAEFWRAGQRQEVGRREQQSDLQRGRAGGRDADFARDEQVVDHFGEGVGDGLAALDRHEIGRDR